MNPMQIIKTWRSESPRRAVNTAGFVAGATCVFWLALGLWFINRG